MMKSKNIHATGTQGKGSKSKRLAQQVQEVGEQTQQDVTGQTKYQATKEEKDAFERQSRSLQDEIRLAVVEQCPRDPAGRVARFERINFSEVCELRLEFRSIQKIDHLWEFTLLTKLDLNNNVIKKIEGLENLINLTWLDLSFNCIERIEGLETLQNLEVLNLSNNKIKIVENMDTLEKLTLFGITNNLLKQLDNVLYLRQFKNLLTLSLFGNPISKDNDYKYFIIAYFPKLKFLDYICIDEKTKNDAYEKFQFAIEEMKHEALQMKQAAEAEAERAAILKLHMDAFVEDLNGSNLFKDMLKDDPEADKLHCLSGVASLLHAFEEQMVELWVQLFETGLAEHKRREVEVSSFSRNQTLAVTEYQSKITHILADFERQHKQREEELQQLTDPELMAAKVSHCKEQIALLCNNLLMHEFQQVSLLEDMINTFDTNISNMVGNFIETAQETFARCRDLEDDYNKKVHELAEATVEVVAEEMEEDMPDDVRELFTDHQRVMEALTISHDNHVMKINDRETQLLTRIGTWKDALIKGSQDKELKLHRVRLSDIHTYVDHLREQLEELLLYDH